MPVPTLDPDAPDDTAMVLVRNCFRGGNRPDEFQYVRHRIGAPGKLIHRQSLAVGRWV
jgi:hypothetical protein